MKLTVAAGFVCLLSALHLALTLFALVQHAPQTESMTVVDPARHIANQAEHLPDAAQARDLALKEALRLHFRWGRYRSQPPEFVRASASAYWIQAVMDDACKPLVGSQVTVTRVVWGANYAKVAFRDHPQWLQLNFWAIEQGPQSSENPTGWQFSARISLIDARGVTL